jgi:hypothetical protein
VSTNVSTQQAVEVEGVGICLLVTKKRKKEKKIDRWSRLSQQKASLSTHKLKH